MSRDDDATRPRVGGPPRSPAAPRHARGSVAGIDRSALNGFEVRLRPATGLRWPAGQRLGPGEAIEFAPSDTDLLLLGHAASRSPDGEPVHQSLMIELGRVLADCRPGPVPLRRLVYRASGERLTYQATRAKGTLVLVTANADRYVLTATLSLVAPDLDVERVGARLLAGTIHVSR